MDCRRYEDWLTDAAAGALDRSRQAELDRHLTLCPNCRAALERERVLFQAIDRGIAASVAAEPSTALAARVRQRVAEEATEAVRGWSLARWVPMALAATILLTLATLWMARREPSRRVTPLEQNTTQGKTPKEQIPTLGSNGTKSDEPKIAAARPGNDQSKLVRRVTKKSQQPAPTFPQVLVDMNEAALVLQIYSGARDGRLDTKSLVALPPGLKREMDGTIVPAPIEIAPLEIADLDPGQKPADAQEHY